MTIHNIVECDKCEVEEPLEEDLELPEGWFWSYKTQKYIISSKPIIISRDMIKKDSEYEEDI